MAPSSWAQKVSSAPLFEQTSLLSDEQIHVLCTQARAWGQEAKQWRDALPAHQPVPHDLKHETSYLDGAPRHSAVTQMDKKLGADMAAYLAALMPDVPIINEEASAEANQQALATAKATAVAKGASGPTYWVIDPIDGTDNFINPAKKEYGVLIGLIENGQPRFGLTYYPEWDQLNVTRGHQAVGIHGGNETIYTLAPFERVDRKGRTGRLDITPNAMRGMRKQLLPEDTTLSASLEASSIRTDCLVGTSARDHQDFPNDQLLLEGAAKLNSINKGGFEWDFAARHAIIRAAGGDILLKESGKPPAYGQDAPHYLRPAWIGHTGTLAEIGVSAQPTKAAPKAASIG